MIRKSLYEELTVHIDRDELAQLLGADPGFEVQTAEEHGMDQRAHSNRKLRFRPARKLGAAP